MFIYDKQFTIQITIPAILVKQRKNSGRLGSFEIFPIFNFLAAVVAYVYFT